MKLIASTFEASFGKFKTVARKSETIWATTPA